MTIDKMINTIVAEMYNSFGFRVPRKDIKVAFETDLLTNGNRQFADEDEISDLVEASNGDFDQEICRLYPKTLEELSRAF